MQRLQAGGKCLWETNLISGDKGESIGRKQERGPCKSGRRLIAVLEGGERGQHYEDFSISEARNWGA